MNVEKPVFNEQNKKTLEGVNFLQTQYKEIDNNIKLENEYLSKLIKNTPCFEKKYENEELNKFKDDILIYLSERNNHYMSLIQHYQDEIKNNKKEYVTKLNAINENYSTIISSHAELNTKVEKISTFETFINKTNDQLVTHEVRLNNIYSDFIKSTQKYDKIYLDNLELPGYIGKFAKFKNCQVFFEYVLKEIDKSNQYKEKNNINIKSYKEKLDTIIKSFNILVKNNNDSQMKLIRQLNDKCLRECKDMNEMLAKRVSDLRIENAKYSMDLIQKSDDMSKEWKKIVEIKEKMEDSINEKMSHFRNIFLNSKSLFDSFKKEFEEFKIKITDIINYFNELNSENTNHTSTSNNNQINLQVNNSSCNNYAGCYINSALPLEKRNIKNFRKFSKIKKSKSKSLSDKKTIAKNIQEINKKKDIINDNFNAKIEEKILTFCNISGKENKKRNFINCLNKNKIFNSIENLNLNDDNKKLIPKKEFNSPKSLSKIEIKSQDKLTESDFTSKQKENEMTENTERSYDTFESKFNNIDKFSLTAQNFAPKSKTTSQYNQSYELENNSVSNINLPNLTNTNSINDNNNISMNSTSCFFHQNKLNLNLNDGIFDNNDHVIKELASELEQSTAKKDKLASSKKLIEDNFQLACKQVSPLNLNHHKSQKIFKNAITSNNNENGKINTLSTDKTDDGKNKNTNNTNQNENIDSISSRMKIFDNKLIGLEALLKEKVVEIFHQIDNLKDSKKKFGVEKNLKFSNVNAKQRTQMKIDINELSNNNIATHNSLDDYFINSKSMKKIAPIIEIDSNNLQLSPSKTQLKIFSSKKLKDDKKGKKIVICNNLKRIENIDNQDNKENVKTTNNLDNWDISKIIGKNANYIGVNKYMNLNRLIKNEQNKTIYNTKNGGSINIKNVNFN